MSNSFDTDLQTFDDTFRKEVPGRVIRVKGDHLEPDERRNNRQANKDLFQALSFNFSDDDEDLMASDVCTVQGMYINLETGAFCPYNMQIDYYDNPDHTPHGFALPSIAVEGPSMFNEEDLKRYEADLEADFKAHWAKTNGVTDAAEAARLCVKHIIARAENK